MKSTLFSGMRKALSFLALITALAAGAAHAQTTTIGWNFTDLNAAFDTGTPANFTLSDLTIANSYGTVTTPVNVTSASNYTGASGGGNIGNAVKSAGFDKNTAAYYAVTLTPSSGCSLQISKFDFGMRSTSTGPQNYALYSSLDNYATAVYTGSVSNNSTWVFKTNPSFTLNGTTGTPITLRLYTYTYTGNPASGTENNRIDDVSITVSAGSTPQSSEVRVETAADGTGSIVPTQSVAVNSSLIAYSITRDSSHAFIADGIATWSLTNKTGGIVDSDLVSAGDGKSAVFTPHAAGSAVIHAAVSGLTSVDSGVVTATAEPTPPTAVASSDLTDVTGGQTVNLTVTVTPGSNPTSAGISVTGNLTAIGGSASQALTAGADNTFTCQATIPSSLTAGSKVLNFTVSDAQNRTATASVTLNVRGAITIFHTNDTHARVVPHKWVVPSHSNSTVLQFVDVGGVAYMGGKILQLTANQPDALVLDGGDISEGNPLGDWNGPGTQTGVYGDGTIVDYFKMLHAKLKTITGRGGRGLDAMVVGNHDIRDITYFQNLRAASAAGDPVNGFHLLSLNICNKGTHTPYYEAYTIVNVNGNKIGIVGYTTESSDSPETAVNSLIDVVKCDWSSTDSTKIHFKDIVGDLRNNQGCNMVILLTHMGHSGLCTPTAANPTPILVDDGTVRVPEVVVSGHWHTYCDTIWQPTALNYKTIFTEAGSFQHYVGELRVNTSGKYISSAYYPLVNSAITPDSDIASYIQQRKADYAATNPTYGLDQIIGYTADNLLLDNYMKWWSSDEYPWSGNNSAGNWICDAVQWKATQLFGQCDLSVEAGGGVRSDITAGPVTYTNIYETFPWADDTIYVVNMTGQQISDYVKDHDCDVALSSGWHVTAFDGNPTSITYNGNPINLSQTYKVAINNYMYLHDSSNFASIDPNPQTSTYLARTALVDYTSQFNQSNPYQSGSSRYSLNTEFSGGYRAVVTMMNDADTKLAFDDGFIRFLSALPETLAHRGTQQVPASLVNADGTINRANRLFENEWFRSYLGFRTGALKPGDIVEVWGKCSPYGGNPEFVDQEGVQADGVEFKIVGHDDSLSKPNYYSSIGGSTGFWNDNGKNHYVKFYAKKAGTSTVADKLGTVITVQDKTGYATSALPGNVGDVLVLTGIPTSENFSLRFRADSAAVASSGLFPPDSHVVQPAVEQTNPTLALSASAIVAPGSNANFYTLLPVADVTVSSANPSSAANGTATTLFLQSSSTDTYKNERSWLRFDLSSIPAGSTITAANLNLYCWKAQGAAMPASMHGSAGDSWSETGLSWNAQPAFGTALDTQTLAAANTWYTWDATSFVQSQFAGDKLASLVVKPVNEDSTDATVPQYKFDSKEFTSMQPYLQVVTSASGAATTVAQVQFFYRYSADNLTNWTAWTSFATDASAPWTAAFNYPNGAGFYEFYSVATDSAGAEEPAPAYADAAVHYTQANGSIVVEQPAGTALASGSTTVDFGPVALNGTAQKTFVIRNAGNANLTNVQPSINDTNSPVVFSKGNCASAVAPGGDTTLTVTYSPSVKGVQNGNLQIASSDPATNPFVINLTGTGLTQLEYWRLLHFGTSDDTGDHADNATPQHDGISNLLKFAMGMDPTVPGRQTWFLGANGANLQFVYPRSKAAVADGILFTVEWSDDLASWSDSGVTETAEDQGATLKVTASIPMGSKRHRFVHLRVTTPN